MSTDEPTEPTKPKPVRRGKGSVIPLTIPTKKDYETFARIQDELLRTREIQREDSLYRGLKHYFVTPGLAALLMANKYGRPLVSSQIEIHRQRIRTGKFIYIANGVRIAATGEVCGGRHRLQAMILEGVGAEMAFEFGENREAACIADQGLPWTAADTVKTRAPKLSNAGARASAARLLHLISSEGSRPDSQIVADDVLSDLNNPDFNSAMSIGGRLKKDIATHMVGTTAAYLILKKTKHPAVIGEFFEALISGSNLPKDSKILDLRTHLIKKKGGREQSKDMALVAFIIDVWNSYCTHGRTTGISTKAKDGKKIENFPDVK